jgi:hypothetical protein
MKPKQSLKIELMPDNKCLIEIKSKESNSIQSSLVINNTNKSNNLISTSKENENKSQNDISNLNDSDILSISKTDSSVSINNEIKKQTENNSNMLISFSNISEANINNNGNSSLTNSIVFNKDKENKDESLTPSTLCNYYQKSNNNTPISSNRINNYINNNNNHINSYRVNQKNLNFIFSEMNNSNEKFNVSKKKTPIKYTKSQLSNHDENNEFVEQRNLLSLFEKSNKNLSKKNEFKIEQTNKIEILNNTSSNNSNFINKCSYFSFCGNNNNTKQSNNNNFFQTTLTTKSNNEIFDESDYISPKFNYSIDKIEEKKINTIQQTNNLTKNNIPEIIHRKEHSCLVKNIVNSNLQKAIITKHTKYSSSNNLPNKQNNHLESNIKINKENENNSNKKNIIKTIDLNNQIHDTQLSHSSNKKKSKSKEKKNDILQLKTMREKIENIISKNISLLTKKPFKINRKSPSPTSKPQRPKSVNKTINFINNIKPLSFITNNIQNIELKDIMKAKIKYSPSPNIRNNLKGKNLRKEKALNQKRKIEVSPSSTHNNSSSFCDVNIKTNPNLKTITTINTASKSYKPNNSSYCEISNKKKLKVIQNFSKYKKKSVINQIQNNNILVVKNKPIFSDKVNKIGGDEDNVNFNFDDI